ncbi:hypothetical protein ZTR_10625 [Talaromyces verruculosus]|nr:hypothetical protein ZTR_10625 [Talaromyces verruculosus]
MPGAKFIPVGEIDTGAFKAPRTVYKFSDDTARLKRLYGPFYDLMIDWKKDVIKIPKLHTLLQGPVELPDRVNVLNGEEQNHPIPRVLDYSRACWLNLLIELGSIHSEWRSQRERERGYQFSFTRSGIMKDAYRVPNYKDWITTTLVPSLGNAGNDVVATSRIVAFPFTNRDVAALCDIFGAGVAGRYADGSYRARLGDATLFIRTNSNGITMAHFEGKLHATPEQWRRYRLQVLGTDISPLHVFRTNTVGKPQKWYGVIKMVEQIELVLRETTSAVANGTFNPHLPSALVSLKADIRAILEAVGLALIVYPNEVYKAETREVMLKISEGTEGLSFREGVREMSRRIIMGPKSKMDERINTFLDALGTDWEAMQAALSRSSSNDLLHLFNVFDLSTYGRRYTLICDLTLELLLSISGWSTFPAMNLSRDRQVFDMCNFGEQIFFA